MFASLCQHAHTCTRTDLLTDPALNTGRKRCLMRNQLVTCAAFPARPSAHVQAPWTQPFRVLDCGLCWPLTGSAFSLSANDFPAGWEWSQGRKLTKPKLVNLSTEKWPADAELAEGHLDSDTDGASAPSAGRRWRCVAGQLDGQTVQSFQKINHFLSF